MALITQRRREEFSFAPLHLCVFALRKRSHKMSDLAQILKEFKPSKEFFIGIDSDGCIFDSMEIKHKECFTPMFIKHFELQAASKYAREVWEFVNLYSKDRGANRFPALSKAVKLLGARSPVQARGVKMPDIAGLDAWV